MNHPHSQDDDWLANPAWVAYVSPFRFIVPDDEEPLELSVDDMNKNTYDHGMMSRIVDLLPTPLGPKWPFLLCYDGGVAVPKTGEFMRKEAAVVFFNTVFCRLLLGGIVCEAVDSRDVVWGGLHKKKYVWPVHYGESVSSQLHASLRQKSAGPLQKFIVGSPPTICLSDFRKALFVGSELVETLPNFSPDLFLRGVTELTNCNWASALSHLWISIEQLTDYLWNHKFLVEESYHPANEVPKRLSSLRQDNRTWSSSVKQEMLYQIGILSEETLAYIFPARQARNRLLHCGGDVGQQPAVSACRGAIGMLSLCYDNLVNVDESLFPPQHYAGCQANPDSTNICFEDWNSLSESGL